LRDKLQSSSSKDTEAVKALAKAIRLDRNLEHLMLEMENDFPDEAGMALAEALTINKSLCRISLSVDASDVHDKVNISRHAARQYRYRCGLSFV
jgi:hypothetical protein